MNEELELVVVEEKTNEDKIHELWDEIVNTDFENKILKYVELSKRQTTILNKIRSRKLK